MSENKSELTPTSTVESLRRPTPKTIEAHSQSRNSYERLVIVKYVAIWLTVALFADMVAAVVFHGLLIRFPSDKPIMWTSHTKDILIVISALLGYLLGANDRHEGKQK